MFPWRTALGLAFALTTLEVALYNVLDPVIVRISGAAALILIAGAFLTFYLLTALCVARTFTRERFENGLISALLIWTLQLPLVIAVVGISEGGLILADDSLGNVGIFGWWYTGIVSVPLIGMCSGLIGWILDRTHLQRSHHDA